MKTFNVPQSIRNEFLNMKGDIKHLRTGKKVRHFAIQGIGRSGGKISIVLVPDPLTFKILATIPAKSGLAFAILEDAEIIPLLRIGNYQTEEEKKATKEAQRMENHERDRFNDTDKTERPTHVQLTKGLKDEL